MPRSTDIRGNPAVVPAVACAATGVGSTLVTDSLAIDHDNRPRLTEAGGSGLARGCLDALRLIGGTYRWSGLLSTFALAFVRGLTIAEKEQLARLTTSMMCYRGCECCERYITALVRTFGPRSGSGGFKGDAGLARTALTDAFYGPA